MNHFFNGEISERGFSNPTPQDNNIHGANVVNALWPILLRKLIQISLNLRHWRFS